MALSAARNTPHRKRGVQNHPIKAATTVYGGGLTCLDASGWAVPGSVATTLKCIGRAEETVVNSGANGDKTVDIRQGVFQFKNSAAGDLIARADIGATCYIVDDETVAKTNGTNTRSAAGTIRDVDAQGVWVEI